MVHSFKVLLGLALIGGVHLSSWAQAEWPLHLAHRQTLWLGL